jgi:hypothetical protein
MYIGVLFETCGLGLRPGSTVVSQFLSWHKINVMQHFEKNYFDKHYEKFLSTSVLIRMSFILSRRNVNCFYYRIRDFSFFIFRFLNISIPLLFSKLRY